MTAPAEIHVVTDDDPQTTPPAGRRTQRAEDRARAQAQDRAARAQAQAEKDARRDKRRAGRTERRANYPAQAAAAIVTAAVLGIAVYAGVFAYDSLYKLAERHSKYVPLLHLAPIGFEATLGAVVIWDIYLTWRASKKSAQPVWFLRWIARLFIAFSVIGNAWAGWPDPVGIFFHLPAPIGFAVIVEAIRIVLLQKIKKDKAQARNRVAREPIPLARWLNDPVGTYLFYRRWTMWNPQNADYLVQVALEVKRLEALHTLRKYYEQLGENWKKSAPPNFLWQLRRGVNIDTVHATILAEFPIIVVVNRTPGNGAGNPARTDRRRRGRTGARTAHPDRSQTGPQTDPGTGDETATQTGAETAAGTGDETAPAAGPADWQQNVWRRAVARNETGGLGFDPFIRQYRARAIELVREYVRDHDGRFPDKEAFAKLLVVQKVLVTGLHDEIKQQLGLVKP